MLFFDYWKTRSKIENEFQKEANQAIWPNVPFKQKIEEMRSFIEVPGAKENKRGTVTTLSLF